jgi:apolipoprotein N-acyltransferase
MLKYFFKNKQKLIIFGYPALAGVLLLLSCNYKQLYLLVFLALVPLIDFFYKVKKIKEVLLGSFIFSFVFWGGFFSCFLIMDIFPWTGVYGTFWPLFVVLAYWLFFVLLMGVAVFLLFGYLFFKFKTKTCWDIFYFSFLWVLIEYLRALVVALISLSPQSLFGPHNTSGFVGYFLASNDNLLQLSRYGGVYLLTFTAVFVNFLIYFIFTFKLKRRKNIAIFVLLLIIVFSFYPYKKEDGKSEENIKVSVLQTKDDHPMFPGSIEKAETRRVYTTLLKKEETTIFNPDIIVFPEGAQFTSELKNKKDYYSNIFGDSSKLIVDSGSAKEENGKNKFRLYYYDLLNGNTSFYDKTLLFPGGEDFPTVFVYFGKIIGLGYQTEFLVKSKYFKGDEIKLGSFGEKKIGGVLCFEIVSPEIIRNMTNQGAQLFVSPSSHSTFKKSPTLYHRMLNIAKVRAVESNRYFIHAGNYIPSSIITNKGEVSSTNLIGNDILNGYVQFIEEKSLYSRFGNWVVAGSFIGIFIFLITGRKKSDIFLTMRNK